MHDADQIIGSFFRRLAVSRHMVADVVFHEFGHEPKGLVMLATRTPILTTVSKTVVSDCGPRTPAREAGAPR